MSDNDHPSRSGRIMAFFSKVRELEVRASNTYLSPVLQKLEHKDTHPASPPPHNPYQDPNARRDDLIQSFDALSLSMPKPEVDYEHQRPPVQAIGGSPGYQPPTRAPGFIGGFYPSPGPNSPPKSPGYVSRPPDNGSRANPPNDWQNTMAPSLPNPYDYGTSLTMQHAMTPGPYPGYTSTRPPHPPALLVATHHRPQSTSALPQSAISASPPPGTPSFSPTAPPGKGKGKGKSPQPKRTRASSTPPTPSTATASGSPTDGTDPLRCAGVTKAGKRCTRIIKVGPALTTIDPASDVERFCFQHSKEILGPSGFYSRKVSGDWVKFEDWIPHYLQPDTQVALRAEMEKSRSLSDVDGYIYTFEIRDTSKPATVKLKVGRAVNLVKRIDQWGKQCGSHEQVLRGWWPGTVEDDSASPDPSLMKGRVQAGDKGPCCHRLERLVHLELADLVVNAPHLEAGWPNAKKVDIDLTVGSGSKASSKRAQEKPCKDCGQIHKEIFEFKRFKSGGKHHGKEWEGIVKPVIEKWGSFVQTHL